MPGIGQIATGRIKQARAKSKASSRAPWIEGSLETRRHKSNVTMGYQALALGASLASQYSENVAPLEQIETGASKAGIDIPKTSGWDKFKIGIGIDKIDYDKTFEGDTLHEYSQSTLMDIGKRSQAGTLESYMNEQGGNIGDIFGKDISQQEYKKLTSGVPHSGTQEPDELEFDPMSTDPSPDVWAEEQIQKMPELEPWDSSTLPLTEQQKEQQAFEAWDEGDAGGIETGPGVPMQAPMHQRRDWNRMNQEMAREPMQLRMGDQNTPYGMGSNVNPTKGVGSQGQMLFADPNNQGQFMSEDYAMDEMGNLGINVEDYNKLNKNKGGRYIR